MKHRHRIEITRTDLLDMLVAKNDFDLNARSARITLGYDGNTQREEVTNENPLFVEWEED